ncbi:hypothetical protein EMPG_14028 [Blastomyces silverae]|uniref:Uncharacterized protein n=1 Tax=Blastomyces silverae TaxID=2060906 RepID=A0A0H1BHI2_9EURO|nr:hypothetical protein EMPG_14028 [Blastomyces silverae]
MKRASHSASRGLEFNQIVSFVWNPTPATTLLIAIKAFIFTQLYHASRYPYMSAFLSLNPTQNSTAILKPLLPYTPPPLTLLALQWTRNPEEMYPVAKAQAGVSRHGRRFHWENLALRTMEDDYHRTQKGHFKAKNKFSNSVYQREI